MEQSQNENAVDQPGTDPSLSIEQSLKSQPESKRKLVIGVLLALLLLIGGGVAFALNRHDKETATQEPVQNQQESSSEAATNTEERMVLWTGTSDGGWMAMEASPPACKEPLAINAPMDVSKATGVLYPGQVRGNDFKPHGGLAIDNQGDNRVEVRAPFDGYLFRGSRYVETGEDQYTFDVISSCGVMYRIGHLLKLSPAFQAYGDQLPALNDSRTTNFESRDFIKAGTVIATEVGFKNPLNVFFDFGVYDLRKQNRASQDAAFANEPLRRADKEQSFYALCWLDLLSGDEKEAIRSLPARGAEGKTSDYCD